MFNVLRWWRKLKTKWATEQSKKHREFLNTVKSAFVTQLTAHEFSIMEGITKQSFILKRDDRKIIAIFVDETTCKQILMNCVTPVESVPTILTTIKNTEEPIGHVDDIPVYISQLMSKAPVFVVGEITWQLRKV